MGQSTNDNERHFLTDHDHKFLKGRKNLTERSEQQVRARVRTRFRCALEDLKLLSQSTLDWNHKHFAKGMGPEDDNELYRQVTAMVGLAFALAERSPVSAEQLFEDGIANAGHLIKNVEVSIDIDTIDLYNPREIAEKVESGQLPTAWEAGMLLLHDDHRATVEFGGDEWELDQLIAEMADNQDLDESALQIGVLDLGVTRVE